MNPNSLAVRRSGAPRKPTQRSRVSNGKSLFVRGGDGRGPWARRMRDVAEAHLQDIGADTASEAERSIIRRIAALTVELERIEAKFAVGEGDGDLDLYQKASGSLRRLLESIGLERRQRNVETLEAYVSANYGGDVAPEEPSESPEADPPVSLEPVVETAMPGLGNASETPSSAGGASS
jgi:hypothetical protein